ncbi:MAG: hypothetical protein D6795_07755, partial [Deltaproteobacteria bacterium]
MTIPREKRRFQETDASVCEMRKDRNVFLHYSTASGIGAILQGNRIKFPDKICDPVGSRKQGTSHMPDAGLHGVWSVDAFHPFRAGCSDTMRIPRIMGIFNAIAL